MAAKNEEIWEYPETITIIAEPSFGAAIKLLLFGAAIGAGAMAYLRRPGAPAAGAQASSVPGTAASRATGDKELGERIQTVAARIKVLAGHTRNAAQLAVKTAAPVIKNAVAEGKRAAVETTTAIEEDLETEPDTKYAEEGERIEAERQAERERRGF